MSYKKLNLSKQLFYIIVIVFVIFFISIGIILPKTVIPVAEKNIYSYLSEPLKLMQSDFNKELTSSEVAYLYIINDKINTGAKFLKKVLRPNKAPIIMYNNIVLSFLYLTLLSVIKNK